MKNKTILFLLLFSLWGVLASLQAMPPKIFQKEKSPEEKKEEGGNEEEQERRGDADKEGDLSSTVERGEGALKYSGGDDLSSAVEQGNEREDCLSRLLATARTRPPTVIELELPKQPYTDYLRGEANNYDARNNHEAAAAYRNCAMAYEESLRTARETHGAIISEDNTEYVRTLLSTLADAYQQAAKYQDEGNSKFAERFRSTGKSLENIAVALAHERTRQLLPLTEEEKEELMFIKYMISDELDKLNRFVELNRFVDFLENKPLKEQEIEVNDAKINIAIKIIEVVLQKKEAFLQRDANGVQKCEENLMLLNKAEVSFNRILKIEGATALPKEFQAKLVGSYYEFVNQLLAGHEENTTKYQHALRGLDGYDPDLRYSFNRVRSGAAWAYEQASKQKADESAEAYHKCARTYEQQAEASLRGNEEAAARYEEAAQILGGVAEREHDGYSTSHSIMPGAAWAYTEANEQNNDPKTTEAYRNCARAHEEQAAAVLRGDQETAARYAKAAEVLGGYEEYYGDDDGVNETTTVPGAGWFYRKANPKSEEGYAKKQDDLEAEVYRECAKICEQQAAALLQGDQETVERCEQAVVILVKYEYEGWYGQGGLKPGAA